MIQSAASMAKRTFYAIFWSSGLTISFQWQISFDILFFFWGNKKINHFSVNYHYIGQYRVLEVAQPSEMVKLFVGEPKNLKTAISCPTWQIIIFLVKKQNSLVKALVSLILWRKYVWLTECFKMAWYCLFNVEVISCFTSFDILERYTNGLLSKTRTV